MALIDASRFTALKARVKAECLRRNVGSGSVAAYGGAEYDYTNAPDNGVVAAQEHYEKLAVPLNAINSTVFPSTSGERIIASADLDDMEDFLDTAEQTGMASSHNDCSASCTGLCKSCTGSCTGGCFTGCSGTCKGSCTGTCTGGCWGGCGGQCGISGN